MARQETKTNAMRLLDRAGVPYRVHTYDTGGVHLDGVSVAARVGLDPAMVYKTLVTRGASREIYVFVIPAAAGLDLKKAARAVGEKSVQMVRMEELLPLTGYVRGGCSPVGMKKPYVTTFHRDAEALPAIAVSAGRVGTQIETDPGALMSLVRAKTADLTAGETMREETL